MAKRIVVIDPGHGGSAEVGGSSPNNATSPSGVLEKNVTLRMGFLVREALLRANEEQKLGVLRDDSLGGRARACLVELEFIDVKAVDELLNIGPEAPRVRQDIADAIAGAIVDELGG